MFSSAESFSFTGRISINCRAKARRPFISATVQQVFFAIVFSFDKVLRPWTGACTLDARYASTCDKLEPCSLEHDARCAPDGKPLSIGHHTLRQTLKNLIWSRWDLHRSLGQNMRADRYNPSKFAEVCLQRFINKECLVSFPLRFSYYFPALQRLFLGADNLKAIKWH